MNMRIIGVDLGVKAWHTAAIYNPATQHFSHKRLRFHSKVREMARVLTKAQEDMDTSSEGRIVVVLEATGMSWLEVGQYFHRQGAQVYRVNGRKTKAMRRIGYPHTHSDKVDAMALATLYVVNPQKLTRWQPPGGELLALQRMCRELQHLVQQQTAIKLRLRSLNQWTWGGWEQLVPARYQEWVWSQYFDPWTVTSLGEEWLTLQLQRDIPDAVTDWIPAWLHRAEERKALYDSPDVVGIDHIHRFVQRNLEMLSYLAQRRTSLIKEELLPLYRQLYPNDTLFSLQGVGERSAAIYHGFIQDIHRFANARAFRQWTGMAPRSFQSGTVQSKHMPLSKQGPNLLKATLYQNANVARQWDVQLAQIYHNQMVTLGKHHTQAVCAVASHLASRIYAILRDQRPYELRDLDNNPISKTEARTYILEHLQIPVETRRQRRRRQS